MGRWPSRSLGGPAQVEVGPVRVLWVPGGLVICQAVCAPCDCAGPAREGLVIQPWVGDGPIEVPPSQSLVSILAIV